MLSLILAAGVVWQSTRSRFIPYVVEVDKLGYGLTVPKPLIPSTDPALVDRMERYEVASFIRDSRSVSSDPSAEQHMLNDMLAHAKGAADKYLDEYFHSNNFSHNPFKEAEHQTVSVQIDFHPRTVRTQLPGEMDRAGARPHGRCAWRANALGSGASDASFSARIRRRDHQ